MIDSSENNQIALRAKDGVSDLMLAPLAKSDDKTFKEILDQYNKLVYTTYEGLMEHQLQQLFMCQMACSLAYICSKAELFYPEWLRCNIPVILRAKQVFAIDYKKSGYYKNLEKITGSIKIFDISQIENFLLKAIDFAVNFVSLPGAGYITLWTNQRIRDKAEVYYNNFYSQIHKENARAFKLNAEYRKYNQEMVSFTDALESAASKFLQPTQLQITDKMSISPENKLEDAEVSGALAGIEKCIIQSYQRTHKDDAEIEKMISDMEDSAKQSNDIRTKRITSVARKTM